MTVAQPTVTRLVEGGVASQPVNRHMNALVGRAQPANNCLSLSVSVCINTWRSRFLLDSLCCLWDSWRVAGKNLSSYILCYMYQCQCFSPPCCQSELHSC